MFAINAGNCDPSGFNNFSGPGDRHFRVTPQLLCIIKTYPMLNQVGHAFGRVEFKFHISIINIFKLNNKYSKKAMLSLTPLFYRVGLKN